MPRFFLEELDESDVCITGPDARHIGLALRMRVGEMLTVCAYGRDYQCRIRSITPEEVHLDVVSSKLCAAEPSVSLTLYQAVPKADKLLCFKIADGLENRTIVSGISKFYKPEELVGKQVCFIANLAPRKLKGIESQGMILSALNYDESLSVITVDREVKPGSEVC